MPNWGLLWQVAIRRHLTAVQRFCELMMEKRAAPKSHVAYFREAWLSNAAMAIGITLDREICC
jgi:hypothetical protein